MVSKTLKVVTKDFTSIKTWHKATEILIDQEPSFKPNPKFRTKNDNWEKWKQFLQAPLEDYSTSFLLEISEKVIDQQANKLTDLIVGSATSFFGFTETSNKKARGWWNNSLKAARKEMKESVRSINQDNLQQTYEKWKKSRKNTKLPFLKQNSNNINLIQNS